MHGVKKYMIAYDLIPYILEKDYLWSYKTCRHHGAGRVGSLAMGARRKTYIAKIRINSKKSYRLLAISKQTKNDFIKYAGISNRKIELWYLGINPTGNQTKPPSQKYVGTTWGYFARDLNFDTSKPFLLYVGGTDARRKLDDLVTAFNHLRAEGHELQLVFVGDILQGPGNLPVKESRTALLNSSYKDDIIYLGFASEEVKNWLYEHGLAFVYPSKYEGFGLPILEAMINGAPVVTYQNSSITEVAGNAALYAQDALSIKDAIEKLLSDKKLVKRYVKNGKNQASNFTWSSTAENLIQIVVG
jgi:glycosyltransferase involved in cell wall biosynthesis